jgi:hypothetical protein
MAEIQWILLLGPLVIVPWGLSLLDVTGRDGSISAPFRAVAWCQPVGALCCLASLWIEPGDTAGALSLAWVVVALLCALLAAGRALPRGGRFVEEWAIDLGLGYLSVGAIWFTAHRFGYDLLGFYPEIVLLTGVHFHFAGFAAPVIAGMTGRVVRAKRGCIPTSLFVATGIVMAGPPLVAAGILWSMTVEALSAVILALGVLTLAIWMGQVALRWTHGFGPRGLLLVAAGSLLLSMTFAVFYALREWVVIAGLDIPTMARVHGVANALGFALAGMLAWLVIRPATAGPRAGTPFSRLRAAGRVGADYFERAELRASEGPPVRGLVDSLESYDYESFDANRVHPKVRLFYEQTDRAWLMVTPLWQRGFHWGGRLFRAFARRVGQLNLPMAPERPETIASRIVSLDDTRDGRPGVRGWVRTYRETGEAVYVAAYAQHQHADVPYMNIAFPLPWSNMSSLLRIRNLEEPERPGGLVLSTRLEDGSAGDEGVYLATALCPIRLPLNETIHVWYDEREGEVQATHDMWLFGLRYLRLNYTVGVSEEGAAGSSEEGVEDASSTGASC